MEQTSGAIQEPRGEIIAWQAYDRPRYRRGAFWYGFMLAAGIGLLIYALFTANYIFALIVVMSALVVYLGTVYEPSSLKVTVTEDGVMIGDTFYPYRDIQNFWFFYDPPAVKSLYLVTRSVLTPRIRVDLNDQDPNAVRQALSRYVRENIDAVDEPLADTLARLLKL
jgi:hypothetical protein